MTITNNSSVIDVDGAETAANLATFVGNNSSSATRSGDYYRFAWPLNVKANSSLTFNNGSALMFEGTTEFRLNVSGSVNFGQGSTLRFTGTSKNHTQVNGRITAYDFQYVIDTPTSGSAARNDPFSSSTVMIGSGWTLVLRGGQDAFVHMHGADGVNGFTILNNKTSGAAFIEFDGGKTYRKLSFPANSGTGSQLFQAPRSASTDCIMTSPTFNQTGTVEIRGATGKCLLIDPTYPNISGVPSHYRPTANGISGSAGDLVEYFTLRADAYVDQSDPVRLRVTKGSAVVFNNTFVAANVYSHPDGYKAYLMEARKTTVGATTSSRDAFTAVFRRAGIIELQIPSFTPSSQRLVGSSIVVDGNFSGTVAQAAAITGVSFSYDSSAGTVAVTVTAAVTAQQIYNFWSHWTAQSAQMGATLVPTSLISIAAGVLNITGSLSSNSSISSGGNVTSGITTTGTVTLTNGATVNMKVTDSTGTRITLSGAEGNISSYVILADSNGNYPSTNAGTIQVSSAGAVTGTGTSFTAAMVGGTLVIGSNQYRVTAQTSATAISLANADGTTYSGGAIAAGTSYVLAYSPIGSSDDLGWVANAASREITVPSGKTFYVYSIVYGYQPKVTYVSTVENTALNHVPESNVNTSLDTTTRDTILSNFATGTDSNGKVFVSVSQTLASYSPDDVLNALHRFIFISGSAFGRLSAYGKSAAGVQLKADGVKVFTTAFYGVPDSSITPATAPDGGIVIPLHFDNLTGDSSYVILQKNSNNVPLTGALWVRAQTSVGNDTQNAIAVKVQTLIEGSSVVAKQATVAAIPTNPLLTTDARLNNLDGAVSAIPSAVWSESLESGFSASRMTRVIAAAVAGKTSQGPTGFTARNLADTQDQVTGQADATGNRTSAGYGS